MQQKRAEFRRGKAAWGHPQVTKAEFIDYLENIHTDDVAVLKPIGDLEIEDDYEWKGKVHLFDQ